MANKKDSWGGRLNNIKVGVVIWLFQFFFIPLHQAIKHYMGKTIKSIIEDNKKKDTFQTIKRWSNINC